MRKLNRGIGLYLPLLPARYDRIGGEPGPAMKQDVRVHKTACPLDCPDTCGVLVTVEDGRVTRLQGDPKHPFTRGFLCHKVAHYDRRLYSPLRVLYPQRRVGAKGEGKFTRITWDEALDEIASRFKAILASDGGEAILPYSYGGSLGIVQACPAIASSIGWVPAVSREPFVTWLPWQAGR